MRDTVLKKQELLTELISFEAKLDELIIETRHSALDSKPIDLKKYLGNLFSIVIDHQHRIKFLLHNEAPNFHKTIVKNLVTTDKIHSAKVKEFPNPLNTIWS